MKEQIQAPNPSPAPAIIIARLAAAVLLINLFVITLKGFSLRESRLQQEEKAAVTTQNLSRVLEQDIGNSIAKLDIVLLAAADEIEKQLASGGIDAQRLNSFMTRLHSRLPELDGLRMADKRGEIAYGTDMAHGAQKNVADRAYFKRHQDAAGTGLFISGPLVSRVTGKWALIISRRVNNGGGSFAGVVYGVIPLEHFSRLFNSIDIGRHGSITLFDGDLGMVARHPKPRESGGAVGSKIISTTFRDMVWARPDSGTYKAVYPVDKIERIYSYRKIAGYPMYITVGLAAADYLAEWRSQIRWMSLIAALFLGVTLLAAWLIYRDWMRKRAAVQDLRRQFLFLQQLLDAIPLPVFYKDTSGLYLGCNTAFELFMGRSKDRIVGRSVYDLAPPELADSYREADRELYARPGMQVYENSILHGDGTVHQVIFNKATYVDAAGRTAGIVGTITDITRQKRDEESLCRINRTLRTLTKCNETLVRAENEPDLLHALCRVITEDGGYHFAWVGFAENDTGKTIRPVARAGFEDGYLEELDITWSDSERGRGPSSTAIRTGEPCLVKDIAQDPRFAIWRDQALKRGYRSMFAIPLVSDDKTLGSLNIYASEPDAFDDEEIELMVQLAKDLAFGITALRIRDKQKQTAEALWESLEQYRKLAAERGQERSLLRALIYSIPDLIFFKNPEGVYLGCNRAFEEFAGREEKDLVGLTDLALFPREMGEFFQEMDQRMMSQSAARRNEEWVEYPDGRRVLLETLKTPFYDQDGHLLGLIGISRDITERKLADEERKKLEAQLLQAQKMEAIGQLAGGIAHDFNNILTAIIGYAQILLIRMEQDSPLRHYVDQVYTSAERAADLTKDLLAFSRKQLLHPQSLDLCEVLRRLRKMLERLIPEDIDFRTTAPEGELAVMADRGQLEQVLMNLVTNARDAMPTGGTLSVDIFPIAMDGKFVHAHGFGEPGVYACISVTDSGHGMDQETQGKIFEPFFTTKEVGKGTGLGMAIIYGIVKQHNGYIDVCSEPARGTTFRIYLPLSSGEAEADPAQDRNEQVAGGTETILLVEDDGSVRELHKMIFEAAGYRVIEALDGQDALDRFTERPAEVDILVTDVIMPKLDGKRLFQEIEKARPDMRVLFMSGYTRDIVIKRGIPDDTWDFLAKPVRSAELLRKVRNILDRRGS